MHVKRIYNNWHFSITNHQCSQHRQPLAWRRGLLTSFHTIDIEIFCRMMKDYEYNWSRGLSPSWTPHFNHWFVLSHTSQRRVSSTWSLSNISCLSKGVCIWASAEVGALLSALLVDVYIFFTHDALQAVSSLVVSISATLTSRLCNLPAV